MKQSENTAKQSSADTAVTDAADATQIASAARAADAPQETYAEQAKALSDTGKINKRRVFAWAMWDWATQPWYTVITTFVFAVYITSSSFGDTNHTSAMLGISTAVSGVLIGLLAPVLGQRADKSGGSVARMRILTVVIAALSCALFFVAPAPEFLLLGLLIMGLGSIVAEIATVDYNSTITQVATRKTIGKVSGFGWGMGYLGGIVMMLALYFLLIKPEIGLFGVTDQDGMDIRVAMILCGIWTLAFSIPTFLVLRKQPAKNNGEKLSIWGSYKQLGHTLGNLWRNDRDVLKFLIASALYRDGVAGVFAFGAVIAAGTFGFAKGDVIIFGAAANIVAGIATMLFGWFDDIFGAKRVIIISLISLTILGTLIFFFHDGGAGVFWLLGMALTIFVGPVQSASRSFLARLIPEGKTGEIFGLYATTGRVVSFLAPTFFGLMIAVGAMVTGKENTQYWGILGISLVIIIGTVFMLGVKDPNAKQAAKETAK